MENNQISDILVCNDIDRIRIDIDGLLECEKDRFEILDLIKENKFKRQDVLIFVLAKCCTYKIQDINVLMFRKQAYDLVELVCKIPTTLFLFISYCKQLCTIQYNTAGWNNLHKRAISNWYLSKEPLKLIYLVTKYKNGNGYNHRDVLRLSHTIPITCEQDYIFKYIVKGFESVSNIDHFENIDPEIVNFVLNYEKINKIFFCKLEK